MKGPGRFSKSNSRQLLLLPFPSHRARRGTHRAPIAQPAQRAPSADFEVLFLFRFDLGRVSNWPSSLLSFFSLVFSASYWEERGSRWSSKMGRLIHCMHCYGGSSLGDRLVDQVRMCRESRLIGLIGFKGYLEFERDKNSNWCV